MKHQHAAEVNVNIDFHKDDVEDVIDKVTDSAITVIVVLTAAHILKSVFKQERK